MSGSSGLRHLVPEPQLRDLEVTVGLHNKADGLVPGFVLGVHRVNITLTVPELWWAESEFTLADRWPGRPVPCPRRACRHESVRLGLYPVSSWVREPQSARRSRTQHLSQRDWGPCRQRRRDAQEPALTRDFTTDVRTTDIFPTNCSSSGRHLPIGNCRILGAGVVPPSIHQTPACPRSGPTVVPYVRLQGCFTAQRRPSGERQGE